MEDKIIKLNNEQIEFISRFSRRFKNIEEVKTTVAEMDKYIKEHKSHCEGICRNRNTVNYIYKTNEIIKKQWDDTIQATLKRTDDPVESIKNYFNLLYTNGLEFTITDVVLYNYNVILNISDILKTDLQYFKTGEYKDIEELNNNYCVYASFNVFNWVNLVTGEEYYKYLD